jgi:hypothetical protein
MKRGTKNVFQCSKKNQFRFPQNGKKKRVEVVAARVLEFWSARGKLDLLCRILDLLCRICSCPLPHFERVLISLHILALTADVSASNQSVRETI